MHPPLDVMKLIPLSCPSCGAKLRVPAATTVTCEYCGTESVVQRREGLLERAVPLSEERADLPVATQRHSKGWALLAIAIPLSCPTLGVAAGVYEFTRLDWMGFDPPILTDVDGDGDLDAVGPVQRGNGDPFIAAFDLRSGDRLWGSDAIGDHGEAVSGSLAVSEGTVLFFGKSGALTALDGKSGKTRWSGGGLGEKVRGVCTAAPGSVQVELADRTYRKLELATGSATPQDEVPCKPVWSSERPFPPDAEVIEDDIDATVGSLRPEFAIGMEPGWLVAGYKAKGSSVPMLAATAEMPRERFEMREPLQARWEVAIPASNPLETGRELHVAVSADAAFALYEPDDGLPRLTAIALADGGRRWDVEVDRDAPVSGVAYGEGRVYVALWSSLIGYDAKTGEEVDRVGI